MEYSLLFHIFASEKSLNSWPYSRFLHKIREYALKFNGFMYKRIFVLDFLKMLWDGDIFWGSENTQKEKASCSAQYYALSAIQPTGRNFLNHFMDYKLIIVLIVIDEKFLRRKKYDLPIHLYIFALSNWNTMEYGMYRGCFNMVVYTSFGLICAI